MTPLSLPPFGRPVAAPDHRGPDERGILFVSHYASRTGAPMLLLRFLRWVRSHTLLRFEVLVLEEGPLVEEFAELGPVHVVNLLGQLPQSSTETKLFELGWEATGERVRDHRVRQGAEALRGFDALYLNSALSVAALDLLPEIPPRVFTSLHDLETALTYWISEDDRRTILDRTDWFITCADAVSTVLVGGFGVNPSRVRRHHGFIDRLTPDRVASQQLRASLGIPGDAPLVGAVGTRNWRKGSDLFVQVAATVLRSGRDHGAHFVWIGGADPHGDDPPITLDAQQAGIADRFHVVGEYSEPAGVFGALDVFALTSREDPFPLVMLEAAACEVPIVSFANGGVVELAAASGDADRPLARVVPYLDVTAMATSIVELVEDPDQGHDMAARASDHVMRHHVTDVAAPDLYDDLRSLDAAFRSGELGAKPGMHPGRGEAGPSRSDGSPSTFQVG